MTEFVMNMRGELPVLSSVLLAESGIEHGFLGVALQCSDESFAGDAERLCATLEAQDLLFSRQVHGNLLHQFMKGGEAELFRARGCNQGSFAAFPEGDGFVVSPNYIESDSHRIAIGIRSADCVPAIVHHAGSVALVHAGWRGIAAGILIDAVAQLREMNKGAIAPLQVVFGPCAGAKRYEVGGEVLREIGECVVAQPAETEGKFLLSLTGSLQTQLTAAYPELSMEFSDCGICTISDLRFHSYRRDGGRSGRNISFVVVPGLRQR